METMEPAAADTLDVSTEVATEPQEHFAVTVDGEQSEVTLSELRDGYQRQADYTRKTQELASERQRLQQAETIVAAMEADPQGTLTALSNAYGIKADNPVPSKKASNDDYFSFDDDEDATADPTEERLGRIEATLDRQAQSARQQTLQREVAALKDRFGEFDAQELYSHALRHKIPNLEAAFAHMNFSEVSSTAQKLQADKDVTDAKRDGVPVASGGSTQAGAVVSGADAGKKVSSLREAFILAKKLHS